MRAGQFTFDDFLKAQKMLKRMGPLQGVLKLIPGLGKQLGDIDVDDKQLARVEAIVLSMTPRERALPHVIDGSRRQRIARGSGTTVQQVNQLLDARKQMEKMMKQMGKGKMAMPDLASLQNGEPMQQQSQRPKPSATKKEQEQTQEEKRGVNGSEAEADAGRLEEEPDLPRRRGRFALAARRQVHRDRRPLQPADRSVDDRARRGQDQGLARQGRAADRARCAA